ncbi:hypothetical protein GW742_24740 [Citrobacter freundii]|nr:hypothetical protein [Citrobacter freundii]MBC6509474.1 hypothetical protein [Citrobacter freundii]
MPRCSSARRLQQVLNGEDPSEWFAGGWPPILKEVAASSQETASECADDNDD